MRKSKLLAALILALLLWQLFRPMAAVDHVARVGEELRVTLPQGNILEHQETHGGFHGDGATYLFIQFQEDISEKLEGQYWHALPMTENVSTVFYGREAEHTTYGALLQEGLFENGSYGEHVLPEIANGCWYFYDRHSEATDPANDAWLYNRHSWNFTAAVYDADTKTLYYFAFDT